METKVATIKKSKTKNKSPEFNMWNVVFYNDNKTPMDYVIFVLQKFFNLPLEKAESITQFIHENNKAVVATYTFEIAEQKSAETITHARNNGYPLKVDIEPN